MYAAVIPELPFQPAIHLSYQEKVLPVKDRPLHILEARSAFGAIGANASAL
jgi:hypothetical protein